MYIKLYPHAAVGWGRVRGMETAGPQSRGVCHLAPCREIGDHVEPGALIGTVDGVEVRAHIRGMLRGLIHPSVYVTKGMKIGDVDPRDIREHCFTISDKAFAVAGGVLEAVMHGM